MMAMAPALVLKSVRVSGLQPRVRVGEAQRGGADFRRPPPVEAFPGQIDSAVVPTVVMRGRSEGIFCVPPADHADRVMVIPSGAASTWWKQT